MVSERYVLVPIPYKRRAVLILVLVEDGLGVGGVEVKNIATLS